MKGRPRLSDADDPDGTHQVLELRRFRRRGLAGVRLEFALAAMGHNFRLFVARAGGVSFVFLAVHLDGTWTSAALLTQRG